MKLVLNTFSPSYGKKQVICETLHKRRFGCANEWAVMVEFATNSKHKTQYISAHALENMARQTINLRKIPTL